MHILKQLGVLFVICLIGELVSSCLPFPFPGSVTAMLLVLVFLRAGLLKPDHIRETADYLLQNMAFFFLPAGVGLMKNLDIIQQHLFAFFFICVISTILTFGAAAWACQWIMNIQNKRQPKRQKKEELHV